MQVNLIASAINAGTECNKYILTILNLYLLELYVIRKSEKQKKTLTDYFKSING